MDVLRGRGVLWIPIFSLCDGDALFRAVCSGRPPTCYMATAVPTSPQPDGGGLWVSSYFHEGPGGQPASNALFLKEGFKGHGSTCDYVVAAD